MFLFKLKDFSQVERQFKRFIKNILRMGTSRNALMEMTNGEKVLHRVLVLDPADVFYQILVSTRILNSL